MEGPDPNGQGQVRIFHDGSDRNREMAPAFTTGEKAIPNRVAIHPVDVGSVAMGANRPVRPSLRFDVFAGLIFGQVRKLLVLLRFKLCLLRCHAHILAAVACYVK